MTSISKDSPSHCNIGRMKHLFFTYCSIQQEKPIKLSEEEQLKLLHNTLCHQRVKAYPMKVSYCKSYLKTLIEKLEEANQNVADELYHVYCCMLPKSDGEFYYKHYLFDKFNDILTMKESSQIISNGTTGLHTWEAATILTEWCLSNRNILAKQKLLELGSGAGFLGLTVAKFCDIHRFCFSDTHPKVLHLLRENVDVNFDDENSKEKLTIRNLDWENFSHEDLPFIPDIVLGSDIVYDPCIFEPLCQVIKNLRILNQNVKIILMNTVRNEITSESFLALLIANNLTWKRLPLPTPNVFSWDHDKKYEFIEIQLKK